mgnify:CR=1 FL=1
MNYDYKVSAAGRVNIIGEHVDNCGGKVFPAALSLTNTVYVKANGTDKINLSWTTTDFKVSLDVNDLEKYADLKYGNYQAGCALVWKNAGHKLLGCDMLQDCKVPFGSGLSSSAAIGVSTLGACGDRGRKNRQKGNRSARSESRKRICESKLRHHGSIRLGERA